MRKRHSWIHTENMHILSYIRATYRLTEPLREWEVGQTGAWEMCLSCKQCMLVIQKIESERCFREREWIKGDPLFLIPPVVTHTRIKAVWKLRQGPKKKKTAGNEDSVLKCVDDIRKEKKRSVILLSYCVMKVKSGLRHGMTTIISSAFISFYHASSSSSHHPHSRFWFVCW